MAYATTAYQVPTLEESVLQDDDTIIPINEEINKGVDIAKIKQSLRTRKAIGVFAKSLKHFRTFVDDLKGTQDDLTYPIPVRTGNMVSNFDWFLDRRPHTNYLKIARERFYTLLSLPASSLRDSDLPPKN